MTFVFLAVGGVFAACLIIGIRRCSSKPQAIQIEDDSDSDDDHGRDKSAPLAMAPLTGNQTADSASEQTSLSANPVLNTPKLEAEQGSRGKASQPVGATAPSPETS